MAYTVPNVSCAVLFDGVYGDITGVQSVQISRGRRRFQDQFAQTTCVVELIPPATFVTDPKVGRYLDIRVTNSSGTRAWFTGRISDIERTYDFPYNSVTGAAPGDRMIITAVGAVGAIGQAGNAVIASPLTNDARENMVDLTNLIDVYMDEYVSVSGSTDKWNKFGVSTTIAAGNNQSFLDLMNYLLNAGQAFIDDIDMQRNEILGKKFEVNAYNTSSRAITFSDNPGAGEYKFTGITYLSGAMETFNEVTVSGYDTSLAKQTANSGAGAPYNELQYQTQLNSTGTMASLAGYLVITQNETEITPVVVRTNTLVADGIETKCYMSRGGTEWFDQLIGALATVEFRGSTVTGIVQGCNMAFYPDHANFEFYLSPFLGAAFTLDSTVLGVLDTNRLGYP